MERLVKKIEIEGKIELMTGMHIGGTNSAMGIGGPDSTIIRNPITNHPVIPGSSIKGKFRSLVEIADGTIGDKPMGQINNGPTQSPDAKASKLFGSSSNDERQRPSRLIVRDAALESDESIFKNTDLPFTESKTEVTIDRITAKAMPRQIERVPAGAKFKFNMVLNVFDEDNENELKDTIKKAMKLLQDDYLGGNGSRGYGQIKFHIESAIEKSMDYYLGQGEPKPITDQFKLNE